MVTVERKFPLKHLARIWDSILSYSKAEGDQKIESSLLYRPQILSIKFVSITKIATLVLYTVLRTYKGQSFPSKSTSCPLYVRTVPYRCRLNILAKNMFCITISLFRCTGSWGVIARGVVLLRKCHFGEVPVWRP